MVARTPRESRNAPRMGIRGVSALAFPQIGHKKRIGEDRRCCMRCGYEGPCVQKDDNEIVRRTLLDTDMVVFATPLYYYGMSAQLKTVIDRFCAYNSSLNSRHLKSALLTVAWNADDRTFDALEANYKTLVRYINFNDMGMVLGCGCGSPSMTRRSGYPEKAYQLGRKL
ncbi:flavodoxin family protein [Ruminococcus sp. M6(2020)]|uniref:Flavodoxin family protein n=2 Tax=Ruminococcus difficilis TaxID=2763069 RepID=A0A934WR57_9FIRM|nr:flavodoxin family protein [Ruminococcus difficilis]